jgi:hypothetical protein
MKYLVRALSCIVLLSSFGVLAQKEETRSSISFEHLHINVKDKEATAKWYIENIDLEELPTSNLDVSYVTDKDSNFKLELSSYTGFKNTYEDIEVSDFHLAFEGHKSIKSISDKALSNGGKQLGDLYTNKIGDYVLNLKDINGFNLQLIHRVNAFYSQPEKSVIRFEHFAFNTEDQKIAALWYVEFMDLLIPWSKDIIKDKNNLRTYRVPYIGDMDRNMTFELFSKDVPRSLMNLTHKVIHIAFKVSDIAIVSERMVYGGAKKVNELKDKTGSLIQVDLYDPQGTPIRLLVK